MSETCIMFGELGARVIVEDKQVQHYAIHVDPIKKEVSCWIASEAGKAFSVVWLGLDVDYPSGGMLYLDGHPARSILRRNTSPITFQHTVISDSSLVPFLFSPLVVTDDDTFLDTSSSRSIGEIKLIIARTTVPHVIAEADRQDIYHPPPQLQKVHERSKKAISHRVNYGSEIPRPRMMPYCAEPTERLVTFIFKYRPLEMLQAIEVVPRNPKSPEYREHTLDVSRTPETSSGKRKHSEVKEEVESEGEFEDEDGKREKALLAEVQRCQAEVERIRKGRHLNDYNRPKKRTKKEEKTFFIPGEIIDLT